MKPVHPIVVLITDSKKIEHRLTQILKKDYGFNLKITPTAREGLAALYTARHTPVLVLIDDKVQDLSISEFCQSLRKSHITEELPICIISSLEDEAVIRTLFETSRTYHLSKPVHDHDVVDTITDILQHYVFFEKMLQKVANQ